MQHAANGGLMHGLHACRSGMHGQSSTDNTHACKSSTHTCRRAASPSATAQCLLLGCPARAAGCNPLQAPAGRRPSRYGHWHAPAARPPAAAAARFPCEGASPPPRWPGLRPCSQPAPALRLASPKGCGRQAKDELRHRGGPLGFRAERNHPNPTPSTVSLPHLARDLAAQVAGSGPTGRKRNPADAAIAAMCGRPPSCVQGARGGTGAGRRLERNASRRGTPPIAACGCRQRRCRSTQHPACTRPRVLCDSQQTVGERNCGGGGVAFECFTTL